MLLLLLALKLVVVDDYPTLFRRPSLRADGTLPGVQHWLDLRFADGLRLIGYRLEPPELPADGALGIDLYWSVYARPSARYQSVVHLVGADGLRWSLPDSFRPRGYADYPPTQSWNAGQYALDSQEVEPLAGAPPGSYDVVLTVFDRDTLQPLSLLNEQGQPAAPQLVLGHVTLTRPQQTPALPAEGRLDLALDGLTLVSARCDRSEAAAGDSVQLSALWRAEAATGASDLACRPELALEGAAGEAARYALTLPVVTWQAGDVFLGQQQLAISAALEEGEYAWRVECGALSAAIGELSLSAPLHSYTAPAFQHALGVTLGGLATLAGFDVSASAVQPGETLTVTLVWRAEATGDASYHVFLHLTDAQSNLVAQSDGVPADWGRPTTGWLEGEYITDVRALTLPEGAASGRYTLYVGLYLPGGERLRAPDGRDVIELGAVDVR